ncbi:MAG: hypothetical protein H7Z39_03720, partial [Burkholderiaceae bacterium]|nr:hypothetical protein [Burkholderiaceae bacterium]
MPMITYGGRFRVTLETYHGVPNGWSKAELLAAHRTQRGSFSIETQEATEPGAPAWLPDRRNWLQYRATLYLIAEGARANDAACIELAVRYIELRYIGSYSGFIRARLARGLKNSDLTDRQKERLNRVFLSMVEHRDYTEEFNEYVKLWQRIVSAKALKTLEFFAS